MLKKFSAVAAAIAKDRQMHAENVDDATAMMSKLSVVPKEKKKNKTASSKEIKNNKPAVFAERSANDPVPSAVATSTVVDDPPLDDDGQVLEVLSDEKQLEYLDKMFNEQAREKAKVKLPPGMKIRKDLLKTKLMPHQVLGVTWLIKQEMNSDPHPLYKQITYSSGTVRFRCSLTGRSVTEAPDSIKGGILADDMGLGKTIQSLALILSNPPAGKAELDPFVTLIVAPKSAIPNWVQQTEEHVKKGNLSTKIYEGAKRGDLVRRIHKREWSIVIVSYETLASDYKNHMKTECDDSDLTPPPSLFSLNFHRIILDEAHTIRTPTTKMFHAAVSVNAVHKLALTGTPFVNSPTDVYSLIRFLNVKPLCDKGVFKEQVTAMIKQGRPCGLTRLRTVMMHVSLRRTKGAVDIALTPKTTVIKRIPFKDDDQKRFHDGLFSIAHTCLQVVSSSVDLDIKKAFNRYVFSIVLRVRQACCSAHLFSEQFRGEVLSLADEVAQVPEDAWTDNKATEFLESFVNISKIESEKKKIEKTDNNITPSPKIKYLLKMIEESMEPDEKGVIFSAFTSFLDLIELAFNENGITFTRLDGSMSTADREAAMTSFGKEEIDPRFILCSLKAAGSGINLTRGNVCFLVDPWFNQASEDQAADRVHRVTQERDVKVFRLVMQDSVEERLVSLQKTKKVLGKGAMEKLSKKEEENLQITTYKSLLEIKDGDWCDTFEDDDSFIIDDKDMSF